jgi:cyclic pyranopterin phosphate synthase
MPEEQYLWLSREDILTVEEIGALVDAFTDLGVDRVRLTGGEPLIRPEVIEVVERIAGNVRVRDLSMTTNGVFLAKHAEALKKAGLDRVSVSLDTLRRERFREMTRRDRLPQTLEGIEVAAAAGLRPLKINTVVIRGDNDDELIELLEFARSHEAELRFIEYMDVGGATRWSMERVVSRHEMLERLAAHYGPIEPLDELTCLYAEGGLDLRGPLRDGADREAIRSLIAGVWRGRADRGAEERKRLNSKRGPLYQIEDLRQDPHREMHTRGG